MEGVNFLIGVNLEVVVMPSQTEDFLTIKKGTVITSLSLQQWRGFYKQHEAINTAVHRAWHLQPDPEEGVYANAYVWKGLPANTIDKGSSIVTDLLGVDPLITTLAQQQFRYMLQYVLDSRMGAIVIGDQKRIRVRFSGKDVQIHLFTYDPLTLAVVTLVQLTFHEFIELYKIVTQINKLTPATDHLQKPTFPHHVQA